MSDADMTRDEAHYELRIFTLQNHSQAARAAGLVLNEAKHLRALLRELVECDMGLVPSASASVLTGETYAREFALHKRAWEAAIAEVGSSWNRLPGDEP